MKVLIQYYIFVLIIYIFEVATISYLMPFFQSIEFLNLLIRIFFALTSFFFLKKTIFRNTINFQRRYILSLIFIPLLSSFLFLVIYNINFLTYILYEKFLADLIASLLVFFLVLNKNN